MLYQLIFRTEHGETVIHIGTHAQCTKTIATYAGAYDLLKDHLMVAGKEIDQIKSCFYLEEYK